MDHDQFHDCATDAAFEARQFLIAQTNGDSGVVFGASLHLTAVILSELLYRGEIEDSSLDVTLAAMKATVEEMTDTLRSNGTRVLN